MARDTAAFEQLYDAVTDSLRQFAVDGFARHQVSALEVDWFEYLIRGFRTEYHAWQAPPYALINDYLNLFDPGEASLPVRVAGHAFLHVGYDLPRVLADSFAAFSIPRARLRALFLRPAPLFRQMFLEQAKAGTLGFLARPLGLVKPMEVLSYWLLYLRSVAWVHAEILADSAAAVRRAQERALVRALFISGIEAKQHFWVLGIPKLDNSQFFQITPLPAIALDVRVLVAAAVVAVGAATVRLRNESVAARIGTLGQQFAVTAPKLVSGAGGEGQRER